MKIRSGLALISFGTLFFLGQPAWSQEGDEKRLLPITTPTNDMVESWSNGDLLGPYQAGKGAKGDHIMLGDTDGTPLQRDEAYCYLTYVFDLGSRDRPDVPDTKEAPSFDVYHSDGDDGGPAGWRFHVKGNDDNVGKAYCIKPKPGKGGGKPVASEPTGLVTSAVPGRAGRILGKAPLTPPVRSTPEKRPIKIRFTDNDFAQLLSGKTRFYCSVHPIEWRWGGTEGTLLRYETPQLVIENLSLSVTDGKSDVLLSFNMTSRQQRNTNSGGYEVGSHDMELNVIEFDCAVQVIR